MAKPNEAVDLIKSAAERQKAQRDAAIQAAEAIREEQARADEAARKAIQGQS